jgi:hypothetical protein
MIRFTGEGFIYSFLTHTHIYVAPYTLTYTEGENERIISDITTSPYIIHSSSLSYVFKNISDFNCNGKILDSPGILFRYLATSNSYYSKSESIGTSYS